MTSFSNIYFDEYTNGWSFHLRDEMHGPYDTYTIAAAVYKEMNDKTKAAKHKPRGTQDAEGEGASKDENYYGDAM